MPALFTRMSILPNSSTAVWIDPAGAVEVGDRVVVRDRLDAERLDVLAGLRGRVLVGALPVEADADVVDHEVRALASPCDSANSRPMPRPDPVTTATRPSRIPMAARASRWLSVETVRAPRDCATAAVAVPVELLLAVVVRGLQLEVDQPVAVRRARGR